MLPLDETVKNKFTGNQGGAYYFLFGSPLARKKGDPFSIIFYDFRSESGKNSEPYPLVTAKADSGWTDMGQYPHIK